MQKKILISIIIALTLALTSSLWIFVKSSPSYNSSNSNLNKKTDVAKKDSFSVSDYLLNFFKNTNSSTNNSSTIHHFGIYASGPNGRGDVSESFEILNDLGIKEISYFNREGLHSAQLDGTFDKFDEIYNKAVENEINIMPWIRARGDSDCTKLDTSQLTNYFSEVIDRYPKIKEWKILKESDQPCRDSLKGGKTILRLGSDVNISETSNPSMTELASIAKKTLKSKCPDCKLVFGGFGPNADEEYYNSLVENNFYENFDVLGLLGYQWFHLNFRPDKKR